MTLQEVAEKAMNYLDSVGVAAEWNLERTLVGHKLWFTTDDRDLVFYPDGNIEYFMSEIKEYYPQKSQAIITKEYLKSYSDRLDYLELMGGHR